MTRALFKILAVLMPVATVFTLTPAWSQASNIETRLRDQLRSTVMQLRDLQNNQSSLQAQKLAAEQERDALKATLATQAKLPKPISEPSGASEQLARLRADHASLQANASAMREALDTANNTIRQANEKMRELTAERNRLQQESVATSQPLVQARDALSACIAKNERLMVVANDILAAYEKQRGSRLAFISSSRVKLENAAQDAGDALYKAKCAPLRDSSQ